MPRNLSPPSTRSPTPPTRCSRESPVPSNTSRSRLARSPPSRLFPPARALGAGADDLFLDVAQPILAEEDLLADEEGRAAERAARDRGLRVLQQALLDLGLLHAREQTRGVEPGLVQGRADHLGIVHLLRLGPHVAEHLVDVALERALELRRDRAAHDQQRVDRKERIEREALDGVAPDEAPPLQLLVLRLVLDALQALGR